METAKDTVNQVKTESSALAKEVENFLSDVGEIVKTSSPLSADFLGSLKTQITNWASEKKATVTNAGSEAVAKAREVASKTDSYVHEEPWKAVGVGVAFGFLLGALVSQASRK